MRQHRQQPSSHLYAGYKPTTSRAPSTHPPTHPRSINTNTGHTTTLNTPPAARTSRPARAAAATSRARQRCSRPPQGRQTAAADAPRPHPAAQQPPPRPPRTGAAAGSIRLCGRRGGGERAWAESGGGAEDRFPAGPVLVVCGHCLPGSIILCFDYSWGGTRQERKAFAAWHDFLTAQLQRIGR